MRLSRGLLALLLALPPALPPGVRAAAPNASDRAMMAGMGRMDRAMAAAPRTGDADRDFVAMMIPHHQGAISMAEAELRYGRDPTLRRLAGAIIEAQRKEIAEMQAWRPRPAP